MPWPWIIGGLVVLGGVIVASLDDSPSKSSSSRGKNANSPPPPKPKKEVQPKSSRTVEIKDSSGSIDTVCPDCGLGFTADKPGWINCISSDCDCEFKIDLYGEVVKKEGKDSFDTMSEHIFARKDGEDQCEMDDFQKERRRPIRSKKSKR